MPRRALDLRGLTTKTVASPEPSSPDAASIPPPPPRRAGTQVTDTQSSARSSTTEPSTAADRKTQRPSTNRSGGPPKPERRPVDLPPTEPDTSARRRPHRRRISLLLPAETVAGIRDYTRRTGLYLNDTVHAAWDAHIDTATQTELPQRRRGRVMQPLVVWYSDETINEFRDRAAMSERSVSFLVTVCVERYLQEHGDRGDAGPVKHQHSHDGG